MKPVVGLLRATKDLVFQDIDNIRPGRKWRRQIEEALHGANLIVLFWCYHSSRSMEVKKEYKVALSTGKDVLPVLLDATPLPEELNEFQRVDFRQLGGSRHRSSKRWLILSALLLFVIIGGVLVFLYTVAPLPRLPYEGPPPPQPRFAPWQVWIILVVVLLLVIRIVRRVRPLRTGAPLTAYQKQMAETLRGELRRRGMHSTES